MKFKEIASVKSKGGLFKVLKVSELHAIVRPLDTTKANILSISKPFLNMLDDVAIYTSSKDKMVPLEKVLQSIWKKFGDKLNVDSNPESLKAFMKSVLPHYDEERVYVSDIKKLIKWYPILLKHTPDTIKAAGLAKTTDKKNKIKKEVKKVTKKTAHKKQENRTGARLIQKKSVAQQKQVRQKKG